MVDQHVCDEIGHGHLGGMTDGSQGQVVNSDVAKAAARLLDVLSMCSDIATALSDSRAIMVQNLQR